MPSWFSAWTRCLCFLPVCTLPCAAHHAWGIVIDAQGRVFCADVAANRIYRFDDSHLTAIASGVHSHELWIDPASNLYGEHVEYRDGRWLRRYWRLDAGGTMSTVSSVPDEIRLQRDPAGNSYLVKEHTLYRVRHDGRAEVLGGSPLAGVQRAQSDRMQGIAVSDPGVYVADQQHRCVRLVSFDGAVRTVYRSGGLWAPAGVAARGGDLYILEHWPDGPLLFFAFLSGPRIRLLRPGEPARTLATAWRIRGLALLVAAILVSCGAFSLLRRSISRRSRAGAEGGG